MMFYTLNWLMLQYLLPLPYIEVSIKVGVFHSQMVLMANLSHCNWQSIMQTSAGMPHYRSSKQLEPKSVRELQRMEQEDWGAGVPLSELLQQLHLVSELILPVNGDGRPGSNRVKRNYTPRSFRHYQTIGCIDSPERNGNQAFYGFRHFIQALLVRKLLLERVPADRIPGLMAGRSTDEIKLMFIEGVEMAVRGGVDDHISRLETSMSSAPGTIESWKHIGIAPGVELHLHSVLPKPKPDELREWVTRLEEALRKNL